jgi:Ala-tRNA(Pro) deacylase
MAVQKDDIIDELKTAHIDFRLIEHAAVYTIAEMQDLHLPDPDVVAKNLFVRDDKKRNYYLLVVEEEKRVDLKSLRTKIGSRPLSFASAQDLDRILNLSAGSVTPFGILNDTERQVNVFVDTFFADKKIGVHPNVNTATVWLDTADLLKMLRDHGNKIEYIDF